MQLAGVYEQMRRAGGDLWALAPQEPATNAALCNRYSLPFPILADDTMDVIRAFGLFNDRDPKGREIPYPAIYLIGMDQLVLWAAVSETTRDRPETAEVLDQLLAATQPSSLSLGQRLRDPSDTVSGL